MSSSSHYGQSRLTNSNRTHTVHSPQTHAVQLGGNLGGNLSNKLTGLRMRAIGQPTHRTTVIMVAHNAVKNNQGAHGFSHDLSLSRRVQRFQGSFRNIGEHHGRAARLSTVRARMIQGLFLLWLSGHGSPPSGGKCAQPAGRGLPRRPSHHRANRAGSSRRCGQ